MDALLKIPLFILLLVACMQGVTGGKGGSDSPPTEDDVGDKVLQSPYILIGDVLRPRSVGRNAVPSAAQLWPNGKVPYVIGPRLSVTGGKIGSDSPTTEDDVGDKELENRYILIGDILSSVGRSAVSQTELLWPNGKVPYVIDPRLKHREPLIKEAMKQYEDRTCVRFVPRTKEKQYVLIYKGPYKKCFSRVGKKPADVSRVSLGSGCHKLQIILHELGHALGVHHEHSRSDRDDYLNIHYENIKEGMEKQFKLLKPNQSQILTPFDFDSIMLYGETLASRQAGLKTITAKDGRRIKDLEEKPGLSKYDIIRINKLYKC